jgi:hypothetical protein
MKLHFIEFPENVFSYAGVMRADGYADMQKLIGGLFFRNLISGSPETHTTFVDAFRYNLMLTLSANAVSTSPVV